MSRQSVHQLRIAIRRLLALLRLLGAAKGAPPGVRGLLRRQLAALGDVRDAQVQLQLLEKAGSPPVGGLEPLRRFMRRRKRRRMKAARTVLDSDKALRRLQGWPLQVRAKSSRLAPRLLRLVDRRLREAISPIAPGSRTAPVDSAARHRTRVLSRECCYMVEVLLPCWRGEQVGRLLSSLRAFQRSIGRIHDRELLLRRIDRLAKKGRLDAASVQPLGVVLRTERAKELKSCSRLGRRAYLDAEAARREHWARGSEAAAGKVGSYWTASLPR